MLILVQFPLIDLRSFIAADTGRLATPVFPVLDPPTGRGRDWFVRGSGAIRKRYSRDEDQLGSEDYFCDASGLVRFQSRPLAGHPLRERAQPYLAFRRLFWDGRLDHAQPASVVGRVDVGIGFKPQDRGSDLALDGRDIDALLHAVLAQRIRGTWKPPAVAAAEPLAYVGRDLAATLLRATTRADRRADALASAWWLQVGRPTLIVEFDRNEDAAALPARARALDLPQLWEDSAIRVHFYTFTHEGMPVPVWFIGHSFPHHRRDVRARLRRCLTRMSAEIAALQVLGRMTTDPRFRVEIERPDAAYFDHFVTSSMQQVLAARRAGVTQVVMTDLVLAALEAAEPGAFANLRNLYGALGARGRHFADRLLNRVEAVKTTAPLTYRYDFFLAHSSADAAATKAVFDGLTARGAKVFLDNRMLEPGDFWTDQLQAAQKASRVTIALVSATAVKSLWFKSECTEALNLMNAGLSHQLVALFSDPDLLLYGMNVVQGIKLTDGITDVVLDALMQSLARVAERAAAP